MNKQPKQEPRRVEIVRSDYQPSQAELEEDLSIDAPLEDVVHAALQSITLKYIPRPKQS